MPLYNPASPFSAEVPAMLSLASRLAECDGFQALTEESTAEAAFERITIGPHEDPWDSAGTGSKYTISHLEQMMVFCQVRPALEEGHAAREATEAARTCPDEGGRFEILIRRQLRAAELNATGGLTDCYLFFTDCVASIAHQLHELAYAAGAPDLKSVRRTDGPYFNPEEERSAQGTHLYAVLLCDWGTLSEGGE